ncbi:MAG: SlyX family protein [Oligoflexia bacterium]|nr:SlyX family protein [Oligoflexia bacterium]
MDSRVTDLEVRLSFMEKNIADLDQVIQELAGHIDAMRTDLDGVRAALSRDVETSRDLAEERPPHW